jgi:hypothetical protein
MLKINTQFVKTRYLKIALDCFIILLVITLFVGAISAFNSRAEAANVSVTFEVNATEDAIDANPGDGICATVAGNCTLRAAVQEKNVLGGSGDINLPPGDYQLTLSGRDEDQAASGDLDILNTIVIHASDRASTFIDGGQIDRVFEVHENGDLTIENVTIQNGSTAYELTPGPYGDGGCINNYGTLDMLDVTIRDCLAAGFGGAINNRGILSLGLMTIENNHAIFGGGLDNSGEASLYNQNAITNNSAEYIGGGIFNAATLHLFGNSMEDSGVIDISQNSAAHAAGGIANYGDLDGFLISISGNQTENCGGGIASFHTASLSGIEVIDNVAPKLGGGIVNTGEFDLTSSQVLRNQAAGAGGVFNVQGALMNEYEFCTPDENDVASASDLNINPERLKLVSSLLPHKDTGYSNPAYDTNLPLLVIDHGTIAENTGDQMGGGLVNYNANLNIDNSTITSNKAFDGAGFYMLQYWGSDPPLTSDIKINNSRISENQANGYGGGFLLDAYNDESIFMLQLNNSEISTNEASHGAGIANYFGEIWLDTSSLHENIATYNGGGLYNLGSTYFHKSAVYGNIAEHGSALFNMNMDPYKVQSQYNQLRLTFGNEILPGFNVVGATSDLILSNSLITIDSSTIGNNISTNSGAGIYNDDQIATRASTIAHNDPAAPPYDQPTINANDIYTTSLGMLTSETSILGDCGGENLTISNGNNISTNPQCGLDQATDILVQELELGNIANNGGPTWTMALLPNSPAIDPPNFDGVCADFDQRESPRPQDGNGDGQSICDIGAYEKYGPQQLFEDVSIDHWARNYIHYLYLEGFTAGCSTDPLLFCPEQTVTRAESSVFVERGVHADIPGYIPPPPVEPIFVDVPVGQDEIWFSKWVHALWNDGYTAGCGKFPPTYCPDLGHTRAEATVFYLRMMHGSDYTPPQEGVPIFADVLPTDWAGIPIWYFDWVNAAYGSGLVQDCGTDMSGMYFFPEDPLTRAEAACMMYHALPNPVSE